MKISDLKPGMRVMRKGTVTKIVGAYITVVWEGNVNGIDYYKDILDTLSFDPLSICDEAPAVSKLSIDEAAFKREILLEIADCWDRYDTAGMQTGFSRYLHERAEKL